MKKNYLYLLLTVLMSMAGTAASAETFKSNYIEYTVLSSADKTVYVSGWFSVPGDLTIPATVTYGGVTYTVSYIGSSAFQGCTYLTSLTIKSGLTTIYSYAFKGCTKLTSVTIPNSVTKISDDAFYNCTALTSVSLPNTLTSIGTGLFSFCKALTSITIPNNWTSIPNHTFYECRALSSVSIPNNVKTIGNYAFYNCSALSSVTLPSAITSIGNYAFDDCGLGAVTIPKTVTTIGDYAFSISTLKTVVVERTSPATISEHTFANWSSATLYVPSGCKSSYSAATYWKNFGTITELASSITFADATVKSICLSKWDTNGDGKLSGLEALAVTDLGQAFRNASITSFNELQYFVGLTSIGNYTFSGCTTLTSVKLPSGVASIGKHAFENCGLTAIDLPDALTSIDYESFRGCKLQSIEFPSNVKTIGNSAFWYCSDLTTVDLGNGVKTIENLAFYGCSKLSKVITYCSTPPTIAEYSFINRSSITLDVYKSYMADYLAADYWKDFIMDAPKCATPVITVKDGKIYGECDTAGVTFHSTVTMPDGSGTLEEGIPCGITVSAYVSRRGYYDSDKVEITLSTGIKGDVNNDGAVTITDAVGVVDIILGGE